MSARSERQRILRARYVANGMCSKCGKTAPPQGYSECARCIERRRIATARRVAIGICLRCGETMPQDGHRICAPCREIQARYYISRLATSSAKAVCSSCRSHTRAPNRLLCIECLSKKRAYLRARRDRAMESKICMLCHTAPCVTDRSKCSGCYEKRNLLSRDMRIAAFEAYGGACACCGDKEPRFLTLDHIGGGGNWHRAVLSGRDMYRWAIKNNFPKSLRLLCMNCNWVTRNGDTCPHQINKPRTTLFG